MPRSDPMVSALASGSSFIWLLAANANPSSEIQWTTIEQAGDVYGDGEGTGSGHGRAAGIRAGAVVERLLHSPPSATSTRPLRRSTTHPRFCSVSVPREPGK